MIVWIWYYSWWINIIELRKELFIIDFIISCLSYNWLLLSRELIMNNFNLITWIYLVIIRDLLKFSFWIIIIKAITPCYMIINDLYIIIILIISSICYRFLNWICKWLMWWMMILTFVWLRILTWHWLSSHFICIH